LAALMVVIGGNLAVIAQDAKKDAVKDGKKDETKKTDSGKKDDAKKDDGKKDDSKKDDSKKDDSKKDDGKKDDSKKEPKKEDTKTEAPKGWAWKAFDPGTVFYQELVTNTTQEMKVMAQDITQKQEQTFYLKWTAKDKKDGNYVVTQEIVGLKMKINIGGNPIAYDSHPTSDEKQPPNPMTDFFAALLKLKLTFTISPKMEIVSIEGQDEFITKLGGANPSMAPLLKHILSKEALKQMAEPTWGPLPDRDVQKGDKWGDTRKNVLDLGPIGTYVTTFTYTYEGPVDKLRKISIKADLTYKKPAEKNGLPFTIKEAQLSSKDGTGVAYFDSDKGRFTEQTMKMTLSGSLTIEVGGMDTTVTLNQTQDASSKFSDAEPAALKKKSP
jgi:hypothetical protein